MPNRTKDVYDNEMRFTPSDESEVPLTIALREGIQRRGKEGFLVKGGVEGSESTTWYSLPHFILLVER